MIPTSALEVLSIHNRTYIKCLEYDMSIYIHIYYMVPSSVSPPPQWVGGGHYQPQVGGRGKSRMEAVDESMQSRNMGCGVHNIYIYNVYMCIYIYMYIHMYVEIICRI